MNGPGPGPGTLASIHPNGYCRLGALAECAVLPGRIAARLPDQMPFEPTPLNEPLSAAVQGLSKWELSGCCH